MMDMTAQEKKVVELNIYENRAKELAAAVIAILRERGQLNYPVVSDAIVLAATERFKRYDRPRAPALKEGKP